MHFKDSSIKGLESWVFGDKTKEVPEHTTESGRLYFLDCEEP